MLDADLDFYRSAFGWETHAVSDSPEFRYTTLGEGENQLAGVMDATNFPDDATATDPTRARFKVIQG